jgi:hypothetical protein
MEITATPLGSEPSSNEVQLLTHDLGQANEPAPPEGFEAVGVVVNSPRSPRFDTVDVLLNAEADVVPGEFLFVLHPSPAHNSVLVTVVQVEDAHEVNPNEAPDLAAARRKLGLNRAYAGEGRSIRIFRVAEASVMEEYQLERAASGDWNLASTRGVTVLSRAGFWVARVPGRFKQAVVGSLSNESEGLHVGRFAGEAGENITLSPKLLQLGAFVGGNPGSGKSYFCGTVLEEARAFGIPTLVIDVNGEFGSAVAALGGKVITLPDKHQFGLSLELLTSRELISIAPNVDPTTQYAELIELAHDRCLNNHYKDGKRITFTDLIQTIEEIGPNLDLKAPTIRTATSRVGALQRDELFGGTFDFMAELRRHTIVSLDCRYLTLRQTRLIAAAGARTLQRYGRDMTKKANAGDEAAAKWFALLFIDEAHMVAPSTEATVSTQVLYELARMGRHVRTGLLLSSQSPMDLDKSVLKRLQTRFIFTLERDQLAAIGGISADFGDEMLQHIPKLQRGTCAVSGTTEVVRHGFFMEVRKRRTPVGGSTPDVFGGRVKADVEASQS